MSNVTLSILQDENGPTRKTHTLIATMLIGLVGCLTRPRLQLLCLFWADAMGAWRVVVTARASEGCQDFQGGPAISHCPGSPCLSIMLAGQASSLFDKGRHIASTITGGGPLQNPCLEVSEHQEAVSQGAESSGGLGGAIEVENAADSAWETGDAPALKGLPDALAELLLRLYDVMIASQAGQTGWKGSQAHAHNPVGYSGVDRCQRGSAFGVALRAVLRAGRGQAPGSNFDPLHRNTIARSVSSPVKSDNWRYRTFFSVRPHRH